MQEVWKDVPEFEDSYQVSNLGNIRSKDRFVKTCGGGVRLAKARNIKPAKCVNGYLEAQLSKDGTRRVFLLHMLVTSLFIPNPNNYAEVNHKDENIQNCRADNLEWCTSKYNANYGTRNARCKESNKKYERSVIQYSKDGEFIKRWDCIADASRATGADESAIIRVCTNRQRTSLGFKWEYAS